MAMFDDDNLRAGYCVGWNFQDDLEAAEWKYFDNRKECQDFAQDKFETKAGYIWMCELGRYANDAGTLVADWMYCWWRGEGIDVGSLPARGYGVPENKSWGYVVEYVPLRPAPLDP